ncbi:pilus assembly protein [Myxococcus sp. MxC21-1]|uniref:pilus assembly protein n=1 Tax=Myxococcus sp. MxC21-1 TaxID=3041439 RepID=UPI00292D4AFE|nr:pilus assembly protein [Myxococcus sp. MxC21-1]WNZ62647.1 pilus assembly protein [Myxococcus sp. MxC21-1]
MMKKTLRSRQARGQSMVEAAIGVTLFVTVVAFGIHFAEVGFLSLKVQEAAISALWDGTHGEMHLLPLDYDPAGDSMRDAANDAQARYADFNGLSATAGAGITQALTTGNGMTVSCDMGAGVEWGGATATRVVYRDNGGTACRAQASLNAWRFPRSFLDQGEEGLYQKRNMEDGLASLQVCAVGRPVGGRCAGSYSMLIDDWGLAGEVESVTCNILMQDQLIPCTNAPLHATVFTTYTPTVMPIPGAASMLAERALFMNPLPLTALAMVGLGMKEKTMWLSAAGEESLFTQFPLLRDPIGMGRWTTTPGSLLSGITTMPYGLGYMRREGCFLGKDCD